MQQIVRGEKNHEFRKYLIAPTVERIWFYLNAPLSHIAYICEIDPGRCRNPGDVPLTEDGLGNKEFNERHKDWDKYDFAYRIRSVYKIRKPIRLQDLKSHYGIKGAPRGLVYVPEKIFEEVRWNAQELILPRERTDAKSSSSLSKVQTVTAGAQITEKPLGKTRKRDQTDSGAVDAEVPEGKKKVCHVPPPHCTQLKRHASAQTEKITCCLYSESYFNTWTTTINNKS